MKKPKQFYVYILRDPRPGKDMQPIYVGKGKGGRARRHQRMADGHPNPMLRNTLAKIRRVNLEPVVEYARYFDNEADAFQFEMEQIAEFGRRDRDVGTLCNLTNGGEGVAGRIVEPEVIEAARARYANPEYAKRHAELTREGTLKRLAGDPKFAIMHADRARAQMRRLKADPAVRIKHLANLRGRYADPEWAEPFSARMREQMRKLRADPKFQAKIAAGKAAAPKKQASPKQIEWARELSTNPAIKAKRLAAASKVYADPQFQARRLAGIKAYWDRKRAAKLAAAAAKTGQTGSTPANDNLAKALAA